MTDTPHVAPEEVTGQKPRGQRKTRVGVVQSDRMDKTVVVGVTTLVRHPKYGRVIRRTSKFKAHDETNDCHTGDTVEIMETRPMSKEKNWRVLRVIERAR